MSHAWAKAWSSLEEGDEGCIGSYGRLLYLQQIQTNWATQTQYNSKHVWLLCQSSCSSPSTKKLHGQGLVHGLFDAKYSIHLRVFRIPHFGNDFIKVRRLKVYFGIFQNVKPASDIIMIL